MHDSLLPYSELNTNFKQIDYLMLAVQFATGRSGLFTDTMFASLMQSMANGGGKIKHLKKIH